VPVVFSLSQESKNIYINHTMQTTIDINIFYKFSRGFNLTLELHLFKTEVVLEGLFFKLERVTNMST
jgi:hypothetical protein